MTFFAPETRSIAPPIEPMPLDFIIQFDRSPFLDTCNPPSTVTSICPPLIIEKDSAESKNEIPLFGLKNCPPASIKFSS